MDVPGHLLLDQSLASRMGNRRVGQMLARQPTATVVVKPAAPHPDHHDSHWSRPAAQYEVAFKRKLASRLFLAFKLTASVAKQSRAYEAKSHGGHAAVAFWEDKNVMERSAGETAKKIQAALGRADFSEDILPGLKAKLNTKLFEASLTRAEDGKWKGPDINVLTLSVILEGDITKWFLDAMQVPDEDRAGVKVTVSGEAKLAPELADVARLRDLWRQNRARVKAAEELDKAAVRAKTVQRGLKAAEAEITTAEKELKGFQGYGKRRARQYGSRAAYEEAKKEAAAKLARLTEKRAALEAERVVLKQSIKKQNRVLEAAAKAIEKATKGLKGKAGAILGKVMATRAGKLVGKFLLHALPIINFLSVAWDIYDVVTSIRDILKHGLGIGGDDGTEGGTAQAPGSGAPGSGQQGGQPPSGQGAPPDHAPGQTAPPSDAGAAPGAAPAAPTSAAPDAGAPARDPDGAASPPGPGQDPGTGGPVDAAGPGVDPDAPDSAEPPRKLSSSAQAVAAALQGAGHRIDDDQLWQLNDAIPDELTPDQLAKLLDRLKAQKDRIGADSYEIVAIVQQEAEKVKRGYDEEPELTWVDGKLRPDLSPAAPADVIKSAAADEEAREKSVAELESGTAPPGTAPAGTATTKPAGTPAGTTPSAKVTPAPKREPPTSLRPASLPTAVVWDQSKQTFVWDPDGKRELESTFFTLSDGLQVIVNNSEFSVDKKGDTGVVVNLRIEVVVFALPPGAGKSYPWKVGDLETYDISVFHSAKSGRFIELSGTETPWRSAIDVTDTGIVPKGHAAPFDASGATMTVSGLKNQSTRVIGGVRYHIVTLVLRVLDVHDPDALIMDADGAIHPLKKGGEVEIQDAIPFPGQTPKP